jgi:tetratricopeptide (TPR) repeat protein
LSAAYALSAIPVRYSVEGGRWEDAARLELRPAAFPWEKFPIGPAMVHFARARGLARGGDLTGARREVDALRSLHDQMPDPKQGYDWKTQIEILRQEAAAWLAQAEGNPREAERLLRSAVSLEESTEKNAVTPGSITPAREMLGELLLEQKNPGGALAEYEAALRLTPNRFNGLSGAARAAELAGNRVKAKEYCAKLVSIADGGSKRPELAAARTFLARNETAAK